MSNKIETLAKIQEVGIVAVVRATSIEQAEKITDACIAGGVAAIELTFTVPHADKLIEAMKAKYTSGEIIIGAGTVMVPWAVIDLFTGNHGIPELLSVAVVAGLHIWKRNTLLSIAAGTILYMILVQVVF